MNIKEAYAKVATSMKQNKKVQNAVIIGGILLIVIIILSDSFLPKSPPPAEDTSDTQSSYQTGEQELEQRLEEVLSAVDGAGQVKVLITYATGPEIEPAMSSTRQSSHSGDQTANGAGQENTTTQESLSPVTMQGDSGSEPLVLVEKNPEIMGVLVIAQGAGDIGVKLRIQNAVQTVLQIMADQVEVLPMTNNK